MSAGLWRAYDRFGWRSGPPAEADCFVVPSGLKVCSEICYRLHVISDPPMNARVPIPEESQHHILDRSRRRCALCIHFDNDWRQKEGQLAHLDRNPANCAEDNLAFLCLAHHDDYDTKRSQTKNLTIREVKTARDRLYDLIQTSGDPTTAGRRNSSR